MNQSQFFNSVDIYDYYNNLLDFEIEKSTIDKVGNKIYQAVEDLIESGELGDI